MKPVLVVLEWHHLGDAILALPFLQGASARFDVRVVCTPASAQVFTMANPAVDVITGEPPWETGGLRPWRQWARQLRRMKPDIIVSVWADARAHWLMALSGAPRRVGFPMTAINYYASHIPWRRRNLRAGRIMEAAGRVALAKPLLTDRLSRNSASQSHLDAWRQMADAIGIPFPTRPPWLYPPPAAIPLPDRKPLWLVHPGARQALRRWPADNFQAVIRSLADSGYPVVTVTPPDSPPLEHTHPLVRQVTPSSFRELAAVVNRVDAVLCNDSAISHLAAALGRKVVTILGPMDPGIYAPYANETHVVSRNVCRWRPCLDSCRMPSVICMEAVTTDMVLVEISRVNKELARTPLTEGEKAGSG